MNTGTGRAAMLAAVIAVCVPLLASSGAAATDVEIGGVGAPSEVAAGTNLSLDITVENRGTTDISDMAVRVEAFGQRTVRDGIDLDAGERRTVTVNVQVPLDASGPNDVEVTADADLDRDVVVTSVDVVELYMTMQLQPAETTVGDPVTISGLTNVRGLEADLYIGGSYETTVTSDRTGHYRLSYIPDTPGSHRVELRAGSTSTERILRVAPALQIAAMTTPSTVAAGELFRVCTEVVRSSPGDVDMTLSIDGRETVQRTVAVDGTRQECFTTAIDGSGDRTVAVTATAGDTTDTEQAVVSVVTPGTSATVFPQQLTLRTGQAGLIRIDIANDELRERTFTVDVTGLDNLTVERDRSVTIGRGDRATMTVRVVPEELGTATGEITVTTRNRTVVAEEVTVVATSDPALKGPVLGAARDAVDTAREEFARLGDRQRWIVIGVAGLVVLGAAWWIRRRRHNVMEPQY